jgi:DNA repair protein RecO
MLSLKGVVLRYTHFGETSAILNVLTKDSGISSVLLHGVKKRGGNYGIGALVEWQFSKRYSDKNDLIKSSKYDIIGNYSFGGDIEKIVFRDCAFELILQIIPQENSETQRLFIMLEKFLKYFETDNCDKFFGFWLFCIRFAQFLGYQINLENCIRCGNALSFSFLSYQSGGFLCDRCHTKPNFSGDVLQILSKGDANIREKMQIFSQKEKIFITQQLISYIQFHCGKEKPLNSFKFFCDCVNFS